MKTPPLLRRIFGPGQDCAHRLVCPPGTENGIRRRRRFRGATATKKNRLLARLVSVGALRSLFEYTSLFFRDRSERCSLWIVWPAVWQGCVRGKRLFLTHTHTHTLGQTDTRAANDDRNARAARQFRPETRNIAVTNLLYVNYHARHEPVRVCVVALCYVGITKPNTGAPKEDPVTVFFNERRATV